MGRIAHMHPPDSPPLPPFSFSLPSPLFSYANYLPDLQTAAYLTERVTLHINPAIHLDLPSFLPLTPTSYQTYLTPLSDPPTSPPLALLSLSPLPTPSSCPPSPARLTPQQVSKLLLFHKQLSYHIQLGPSSLRVNFPSTEVWQKEKKAPPWSQMQQWQRGGKKEKGKGKGKEADEEQGEEGGEEGGEGKEEGEEGREDELLLDRGWILAPVVSLGEGAGVALDWKLVDESNKLFPLRDLTVGEQVGKGEEAAAKEGALLPGALVAFRPGRSVKTKLYMGVKEVCLTVGELRRMVRKRKVEEMEEAERRSREGGEGKEGEEMKCPKKFLGWVVRKNEVARLFLEEFNDEIWEACTQEARLWLVERLTNPANVFRQVGAGGWRGSGEKETEELTQSLAMLSARMEEDAQEADEEEGEGEGEVKEGVRELEDMEKRRRRGKEKYRLLCGELSLRTGLTAELYGGWQVGMGKSWEMEGKLKVASLLQRVNVRVRDPGRLVPKALMKPEYERLEVIGDCYLKVRKKGGRAI